MNIADILIWEATNGFLLVMLTRWIRERAVFTERDWLFLTGHPREKVLSLHLWLRFAVLWFAVVFIGLLRVTFSCPLVSHHSLARRFSLPLSFGALRRSGYVDGLIRPLPFPLSEPRHSDTCHIKDFSVSLS